MEANLFEFVYNTVALTCSEEVWESILQEYTHESLQSKQRYLMKALASTADIKIIKKLLRYTMGKYLSIAGKLKMKCFFKPLSSISLYHVIIYDFFK